MTVERGYIVEPKATDLDCHWRDSHYSRMGDKIAREQPTSQEMPRSSRFRTQEVGMSAEKGYIVPPKNTDHYAMDWNESHYSRMGEKIAEEQRERMREAEAQAAGRDSQPETS